MDIIGEIIRAMVNDPDKPPKGIHCASLTYTCLRQAYYSIVSSEIEMANDLELLGLFFRGKAMDYELKRRLVQFGWKCDLPNDRFEITYQGIMFHPDAYHPKTHTLIEMKVTSFIPRDDSDLEKYFSHYKKQVQYYTLALTRNNMPVDEAYLLFMDVSKGFSPKVFKVDIPNLDELEKEMMNRKSFLEDALNKNQIPDRSPGHPFPCSYCDFIKKCWSEELVKPSDIIEDAINITKLKREFSKEEFLEMLINKGYEFTQCLKVFDSFLRTGQIYEFKPGWYRRL